MTLENVVDEAVEHIVGDIRAFNHKKEIVSILNDYKELRVDGFIAKFLPLTIGASFWHNEVTTKKYTRFKNKLLSHRENYSRLKCDGYLKDFSPLNRYIFEKQVERSLKFVGKQDLIIKIYYYELLNLLKEYNIKKPRALADNIVFDLFDYKKTINPYKKHTLHHLSEKIYYYST